MKITAIVEKVFTRMVYGFKLNPMIYRFSRSNIISYDDNTVKAAREFLESYSPNPKTSCVCNNRIEPYVDIHIIIPAYNVEKYVKDCLDSILCNPTKKYTYLVSVINDGSTDNTANILQAYENHPCVEVITQANKGFSGARNTGLSHIKGRYVVFVDSDDLMDWCGVEKMMDTALETGADIVRGAYTTMFDNGEIGCYIANATGRIDTTALGGVPWAKLYRSQLFCDVCFPEHYWYEDSIFSHIVFPRISVAYGIAENTYYYRDRVSGITNQGINKPKSIDSYWITEQLFEERRKYGLGITKQYYEKLLGMVRFTFSRIRLQPKEVKEYIFILFCDFFDRNFSDFSADSKQGKEIEKIIRTRNLGKCISYAKWM